MKNKKTTPNTFIKLTDGTVMSLRMFQNENGVFSIPVQEINLKETKKRLFVYMAKYIAKYLKSEKITSCKQWDIRDDNESFHDKTIQYILNAFATTWHTHLNCNIDLIEAASIFHECTNEMLYWKKSQFEIITHITDFKYEWLPILNGIAICLEANIEDFAPQIKERYKITA